MTYKNVINWQNFFSVRALRFSSSLPKLSVGFIKIVKSKPTSGSSRHTAMVFANVKALRARGITRFGLCSALPHMGPFSAKALAVRHYLPHNLLQTLPFPNKQRSAGGDWAAFQTFVPKLYYGNVLQTFTPGSGKGLADSVTCWFPLGLF